MKQTKEENFYNELPAAIKVLKQGGIIIYPTDTIWGIGCDATDEKAISRVFAIKQREEKKSLIILVDTIDMLARYVKEMPPHAPDLIEYAERPLTIIYPTAQNLPANLTGDDGSVAIRVVKNPFCKELIARLGKPVVSTSANISGSKPPAFFGEIDPILLQRADYVVNLRQNEKQHHAPKPSVIIKLGMKGEMEFIRK